jgi:hypothetical protein
VRNRPTIRLYSDDVQRRRESNKLAIGSWAAFALSLVLLSAAIVALSQARFIF